MDRTHLLEDTFALADAGELDYTVPLSMTRYLLKEKHFSPWFVAASKIKNIITLLESTSSVDKFERYVRELVDSIYNEISWKVSEKENPDQL